MDGETKRCGFYTTRYVEAADRDAAEQRAVDAFRDEGRLRGLVVNDPSDPPMLFADEIDEIETFNGIESLTPSLVFFPDESAKH
ncbi:MAG: hypothetical protein GEU89_09185 [Kiloniellaceae bacterium]|nr:hypothetical protein [Kiloniellaceae bacterium]